MDSTTSRESSGSLLPGPASAHSADCRRSYCSSVHAQGNDRIFDDGEGHNRSSPTLVLAGCEWPAYSAVLVRQDRDLEGPSAGAGAGSGSGGQPLPSPLAYGMATQRDSKQMGTSAFSDHCPAN